ncbi:MAG: DUF3352 domain-containing protein [Cyanobacteria bacterium P01_A01_bin.84]
MSNNKVKIILPAVGAAVIAVGAVTAYLYLKGGPSGTISDAVGSAKLVPDEALVATYISTDPKTWSKLKEFGTPEAQKLLEKGISSFNKDLEKDNMSYEKDIKPWIGGVMIAVLPSNPTQKVQNLSKRKPQPDMLMVIGVKDKLAALDFSNKLKSQKNSKTKEINYKDEKIIESINKKGSPSYVSLLNDRLVFAPKKVTIEKAIDTYKGKPSLASKESARDLFQKKINLQNTLLQVYVPNYYETIQKLGTLNSAAPLPPTTLKQLKSLKAMVFGIGVDDAGIRMKAIANIESQSNNFQPQETSSNVINALPVNTIASINGKGLKNVWSSIVKQSQDYPELGQVLEQMRQQTQTLNLNLDKDVFSWMDGEFTIAAVPGEKGILANTGFGGALILDTSDRKTTEATLSKLNNIAQKQAPFKIGKTNINGKEVTQWSVPGQGTLVNHGWLDNDTVFLAVGDPVAKSIISPQGSLKESDNFKAIAGSLEQPNTGYFYMDMDQTMKIVNRFTPTQSFPPEARAILSSIRGLAISGRNLDGNTSEAELLLALRRNTTAKK